MTEPDERYAKVMVDFAAERAEGRDLPLEGDDAATLAVNAIFCDLRDRRLLKWIFGPPGSGDSVMPGLDRIDDETQVVIAAQWRETIRRALARGQHDRL